MKLLENVFKVLSLVLGGISIFYLSVSIYKATLICDGFIFDRIYISVVEYAGLHGFTLVMVSTLLALYRFRLSSESHIENLEKLKFTEEEVLRRRTVETNSQTLKMCENYLSEFQLLYNKIISQKGFLPMQVEWRKLGTIDRKSLKANYEIRFSQIENFANHEALLTLHRLEAFSASFIHGDTDMELGNKMIGEIFVKQTNLLLGLIAYYRSEGSENVFLNILSLKNEWEID